MAYKELENDIYPLRNTSLTDPGASDINTAMLDYYSSVVITLTTTGNVMTLGTPGNTALIKRFTVINNNTSTHEIIVNNIPISPGVCKYFIWDGTAWTLDLGSIVGQSLVIPNSASWFTPYTVNSTAASTVSPTADIQYWLCFRTIQEHVVHAISLSYTVGVASNSMNLGIYESDERGFPTNLLIESGLQAATAGGGGTITYTFPSPIVLKTNKVYWIAYAINQAGVTIRGIVVSGINNLLGCNGAGATTQISQLRTTLSGGWTNFPNPAPATGSYTYSGTTNGAVLLQQTL